MKAFLVTGKDDMGKEHFCRVWAKNPDKAVESAKNTWGLKNMRLWKPIRTIRREMIGDKT